MRLERLGFPALRPAHVQVLTAISIGILLALVAPGIARQMKPVGDTFVNLVRMVIAPVIYTWFDDLARKVLGKKKAPIDRGAEEVGVIDLHKISSTQA